MKMRFILLTTTLSLLAGCAETVQPVVAAPAVQPSADARLTALFTASDEASLKRNPINALYRGDLRYADQLGDYVSDAYFAAERAAAESDLKALLAIDRAALTPTNQIAYDVFKWQTGIALKGLTPEMLALTAVRPLGAVQDGCRL